MHTNKTWLAALNLRVVFSSPNYNAFPETPSQSRWQNTGQLLHIFNTGTGTEIDQVYNSSNCRNYFWLVHAKFRSIFISTSEDSYNKRNWIFKEMKSVDASTHLSTFHTFSFNTRINLLICGVWNIDCNGYIFITDWVVTREVMFFRRSTKFD